MQEVKAGSIAVFRLGGLGDYLLTLPFFKGLRALYPEAKITAIVGPAGEEILQNQGVVDHCMIAQAMSRPGSKVFQPLGILQDFFDLRKKISTPYDLFIDLTSKYSMLGALKPRLVKSICQPRKSVGLDYLGRGNFLDIRVPEDRHSGEHILKRYGRVLEVLGGSRELRLPEISVPEHFKQKAREFYQEHTRGRGDILRIGIHPGANQFDFEARAWPAERFAILIQQIVKQGNIHFFMTGASYESWLYEKLSQLTNGALIQIPVTENITELWAYLSLLDGYISNDTGPMHCAACLGIPTIGIFGNADFASYGTYPSEIPLHALVHQNACKEPKDPRGLKQISVDQVFQVFSQEKNKMETRRDLRLRFQSERS